jgi:Ca2+-binding RTX toxin-like protein
MPRGKQNTTNDVIYVPTSGADNLFGTTGTDCLRGGEGNDTLTGGGGVDIFISEIGSGDDCIMDFSTSGGNHDLISFNDFGMFVDAGEDNYLDHVALRDGQTLQTVTGHVLTVVASGADTVLQWDTGDSITIAGVAPGKIFGDWIVSYGV